MKKQTIGTKVEGVVDYVTNQSIRRNTPFRLTKFGEKIYFYEGKEIAEDVFHIMFPCVLRKRNYKGKGLDSRTNWMQD